MKKIAFLFLCIIPLLLGCVPRTYEYYTVEPVKNSVHTAKTDEVSILPYFGFGEKKIDSNKLKVYGPPLSFYIIVQDGTSQHSREIIELSDIDIYLELNSDRVDFEYEDWENWQNTKSKNGVNIIYSQSQKIDFEWEKLKFIIVNISFNSEFRDGEKTYTQTYSERITFKPIHKVNKNNAITRLLMQ